MGYLDKQSRVIDIVLTERGRKLFSVGKLDFSYFGLFDDGIDYDPPDVLSDEEVEVQIESTPMMEAPFIPDVWGNVAPLEPVNHLFTAAPGYSSIPHVDLPLTGTRLELRADQRRESDGSYRRTGTSHARIDMTVTGDSLPVNQGFIVRVLSSGSDITKPLEFRHDLQGRRAYDPFIAASVDSEDQAQRANFEDPSSVRIQNPFVGRKS